MNNVSIWLDTLRDFNEKEIIEFNKGISHVSNLLKISEKDTESLEWFIMQKLLRLGILRTSTTNVIFCQQKYTTALTL